VKGFTSEQSKKEIYGQEKQSGKTTHNRILHRNIICMSPAGSSTSTIQANTTSTAAYCF